MLILDWGALPDGTNPWTISWAWTQENNQTAWQDSTPWQQNTPNPSNDSKPTSKDPWAEMRYQISRAKENEAKAMQRVKELEEKLKTPKPEFNQDTDPDGSKEIEYRAKEIADKSVKEMLEKLWLDDKIAKLEYEKQMDNFYKHIDSVASEELWKFWIKLTRDEAVNVMQQIEEKWFTPLQVAILAKWTELLAKLKPESMIPWDGQKPDIWWRALTQEEINEKIFREHWMFWR